MIKVGIITGALFYVPTSYPAITRDKLLELGHHGTELHYTGRQHCGREFGPKGRVTDSVVTCRISSQVKTWKRRPGDFRVAVKRGLYENHEIVPANAGDFHLASECPLHSGPKSLAEAEALRDAQVLPAQVECGNCGQPASATCCALPTPARAQEDD